MNKMAKSTKISTLFMNKMAENHTLWDHTYLFSPYKRVPPSPLGTVIGVFGLLLLYLLLLAYKGF